MPVQSFELTILLKERIIVGRALERETFPVRDAKMNAASERSLKCYSAEKKGKET